MSLDSASRFQEHVAATGRILSLKGILWLCWIMPAAGQVPVPETDYANEQAAAIELARSGRYPQALDELAQLRTRFPDDAALLHDEIAVLGWANRDEEVRARAALVDPSTTPVYALVAIGKSMRNLARFQEAIDWYSHVVQSDPGNTEARLGLVFAHADNGDAESAQRALVPLRDSPDFSITVELMQAYIEERSGSLIYALSAYDRVLTRDSNHREALRGKALVLRRLLLPSEALALAAAHPGILSDAEIGRLRADEIALQVRFGEQVAYPIEQEHVMTDRAIAALNDYLAQGVIDPETEVALRFDRVIALAERGASREAIDDFEGIRAEHPALPAPVLAAAGKAYLDLREPELALDVLQQAVELERENIELESALFYAYADLDRHEDALALAQQVAARLPVMLGPVGSATAQPNPDRLRAEMLIGIALAYADRLVEAQAHLERLLAAAPHNADIRHELANVYRWRGWLDRSLFEYQQVLAVEPELLEARVGRAYTELDRGEFAAVASEVDSLNQRFSERPGVERLNTLWTAHNRSELRVDATAHESSGITFGSRQHNLGLMWLSAPIDYRYRWFVRSLDSFAEFPEGDSRRRRLGAGLQYQYGRWLASAELSGDRDGGGDLGLRGSAEYRFNDYWVLISTVELQSDSVPLRGHRVGLDSDLISVGARYAPHESLTLQISAAFEDMSDGNSRQQLAAEGRKRLVNRSRFVVEALGEAFIGNRDRDDVPYFSPLHDVGLLAGAEAQWRVLNRYERRVTHILRGEAGFYDQSGFSSGRIWRVAYMLPVELSPSLSTWFGLWRSRMFYDGAGEYSTTASFSLQVRF